MPPAVPTSTLRRLILGYVLLLVLFAGGSAAALMALVEAGESLARIREEERQVRMVLEVATALRDQYAHEAHMVILGNDSHLPMYEASLARLDRLYRALEHSDLRATVRKTLRKIRASSERLDALFRAEVLPSIRQGRDIRHLGAHQASLDLVLEVQARADQLAARLTEDIATREAAAARTRRRATAAIATLLLLAVLVALALGRYVAGALTAPLEQVRAAVARWAGGDLSARIHLDRDDELGSLAAQLDTMAEAVSRLQRERLDRERLAAVGRLAAGVAHEINNPLSVIHGYAKLLAKDLSGEAATDLAAILEETERAREIVTGLIDLSRPWRAGDEAIALDALVLKCWQRLAESGQAEGVTLHIDGHVSIRGSRRGIEQVLLNLLRNAAQAANDPGRERPGPGRVEVRLRSRSEGVEVRIDDDGPGIDPGIRDRLFEPFATAREGGTGLGLAVSRAIVLSHGGRLTLETSPSGGARATLSLPLHPPAPPPPRPPPRTAASAPKTETT